MVWFQSKLARLKRNGSTRQTTLLGKQIEGTIETDSVQFSLLTLSLHLMINSSKQIDVKIQLIRWVHMRKWMSELTDWLHKWMRWINIDCWQTLTNWLELLEAFAIYSYRTTCNGPARLEIVINKATKTGQALSITLQWTANEAIQLRSHWSSTRTRRWLTFEPGWHILHAGLTEVERHGRPAWWRHGQMGWRWFARDSSLGIILQTVVICVNMVHRCLVVRRWRWSTTWLVHNHVAGAFGGPFRSGGQQMLPINTLLQTDERLAIQVNHGWHARCFGRTSGCRQVVFTARVHTLHPNWVGELVMHLLDQLPRVAHRWIVVVVGLGMITGTRGPGTGHRLVVVVDNKGRMRRAWRISGVLSSVHVLAWVAHHCDTMLGNGPCPHSTLVLIAESWLSRAYYNRVSKGGRDNLMAMITTNLCRIGQCQQRAIIIARRVSGRRRWCEYDDKTMFTHTCMLVQHVLNANCTHLLTMPRRRSINKRSNTHQNGEWTIEWMNCIQQRHANLAQRFRKTIHPSQLNHHAHWESLAQFLQLVSYTFGVGSVACRLSEWWVFVWKTLVARWHWPWTHAWMCRRRPSWWMCMPQQVDGYPRADYSIHLSIGLIAPSAMAAKYTAVLGAWPRLDIWPQ